MVLFKTCFGHPILHATMLSRTCLTKNPIGISLIMFLSEYTEPIANKVMWNCYLVVLYQIFVQHYPCHLRWLPLCKIEEGVAYLKCLIVYNNWWKVP